MKANIAVNIRSKEESEQVQMALYAVGYNWFDNSTKPYDEPLRIYKEKTAIWIESPLLYGSVPYAIKDGLKVVSVNKFFGSVLPTLEPIIE